MCNFNDFEPHRESLPRRYCAECNAVLSTGNLLDLCWPCGHSWGLPFETRYNPDRIGDAIDRMLVAA